MANWDRALQDFIAQLDEKVTKARQITAELQTSLRAYYKALELANGASAKAISELIAQQTEKLEKSEAKLGELICEARGARGALEAALSANRKSTEAPTARRLSKTWTDILLFISTSGEKGKTLEEIQYFIEENKLNIKDTAVRSQLSIYGNPEKNFVEALGAGLYKITETGRAVLEANVSE